MENKGNSHRECVLSSRVLLNVLDSPCIVCVQRGMRLTHTHRLTFRQKRGCDGCCSLGTEWGWRTKRVPRKQYAPEFTVPTPLENKGGGSCVFSVCFLWVHRRANFWSQTKLAALCFLFPWSTATQLQNARVFLFRVFHQSRAAYFREHLKIPVWRPLSSAKH
jgi:hypothetical protein